MHERQGFKPGTLTTGSKGSWPARANALSLSEKHTRLIRELIETYVQLFIQVNRGLN